MVKIIISTLLFMVLGNAQALSINPLPPEQAFQLSTQVLDDGTIQALWTMAPGYYLYKDHFNFTVVSPEEAKLGKVSLPPGIAKQDDVLGKYQIYMNQLKLSIPIDSKNPNVDLLIAYQGCAESGFCYPPREQLLSFDLTQIGTLGIKAAAAANLTTDNFANENFIQTANSQNSIKKMLTHQSLWLVLLSFFGFGLLLSFTPCVLPMIPILSGIIVGDGAKTSARKAFLLSLIYVLGMAITYAIAGVIVATAGANLQTALQKPWVIVSFSLVFVVLALSLFGLFDLRLPYRWQHKLILISNQQKSGNYLGVAIMGMLSTLIVSPCVTAPLVGALAYIAQTGNSFLGASALFTLALGMGLPLIIIGTTSGKLIPKAGPWINHIKAFFGVLLLAVAIYLLERIIPDYLSQILWACFFIGTAVFLGAFQTAHNNIQKIAKMAGLIFFIYGTLMLIAGSNHKFKILPERIQASEQQTPLFTPIKSITDFNHQLATAQSQGKMVMLDFYADWCVACKVMEKNAFADPKVRQLLNHMLVLQADVTANDETDKALEKYFGVIAPPSILFFAANGEEISDKRVVGEMSAEEFYQHLQKIIQPR